MKHNNSHNVLQLKIEENLVKLHKKKVYAHHATTPIKAKEDDKEILSKARKWGIIKRQLNNQRAKHFVVKALKPQPPKQKPLKHEDLMLIIRRTLILQNIIICLYETVSKYSRLAVLCIFFQCALSIVFNSYNLVLFLLKAAYSSRAVVHLKIFMIFFFYGFHITTAFLDTLATVIVHQCVYKNIRKTGQIMDEMNLYISDDVIKSRLSQFSAFVYNNLRPYSIYGLFYTDGSFIQSLIAGTTTYIIILIQYSGDGEICKHPSTGLNQTKAS